MTCFKLQGMWSQNQKTAELGRGPIWTHPILEAGLTRVGYSVLCLAGFWVSQNRRTPKYLWTASFWIQQLKKDLKCSSVISCISFCPIAFSLTEYHWKEHSSTVFIFPLQVVAYIGKVPLILLFSSWTIPALSLSSYVRCSSPFSLWSFIALLPVCLCLSCTVETTTRYNTACCLLTPTEERGRIIPSWLAGNAPFNAFRDAFSNLCCKSTMLTHVYQYSLVLL